MTARDQPLATQDDAACVANALFHAVSEGYVIEGASVRKLSDTTAWFDLILPDGKELRIHVIH